MGKSHALLLSAIMLAAVAGVAVAGKRERKPTTYAVNDAVIRLPESGIAYQALDAKNVAFGPNPGQVIRLETGALEYDDVLYTLTMTTLPESLRNAPTERLLAGAKRGLLEPAGQGAELDLEQRKQVAVPGGKVEALALNIRVGKNRVRARIVAHEGRIIQLTAVGSRSDVEGSVVSAALDTFEIVAHAP